MATIPLPPPPGQAGSTLFNPRKFNGWNFLLALFIVYTGWYLLDRINRSLGWSWIAVVLLSVAIIFKNEINSELRAIGVMR